MATGGTVEREMSEPHAPPKPAPKLRGLLLIGLMSVDILIHELGHVVRSLLGGMRFMMRIAEQASAG